MFLTFSAVEIVHAETTEIDGKIATIISLKPDLEHGRKLYHNCALCHTPEGWGSVSGFYPQIAGQHQSVIIKQLFDISQGNRDNPTMIPFAETLFKEGDQALADLSAYISRLPMVPNNSIGSGFHIKEGEKIYKELCQDCHAENGEGIATKHYPRIQGQHYRYLYRQLQWIKNGKRRNSDKKMARQIQGLGSRDLDAVADFISRLKPDKALLAERLDWRNPDFSRDFKAMQRSPDKME